MQGVVVGRVLVVGQVDGDGLGVEDLRHRVGDLQRLRLEEQELRVRMESLSERVFSEYGLRIVEVIAAQQAAEAAALAELK